MHSMSMQKIVDIIEAAGGVTKFARQLGVPVATVSSWGLRNQIPVRRVIDVERVTGIPRHQLRPDIYPNPHLNEVAL